MTETTKKHPLLENYFKVNSFENLLSIKSSDAEGVKNTIQSVEKMMGDYAGKITYTQIRNILQLVKNKDFEKDLGAFYKTLPMLAYTEARLAKNDDGRKVISFIRELASAVKQDQYNVFVDIMNTIVAYHKLNS